jgi:hypothetical protein
MFLLFGLRIIIDPNSGVVFEWVAGGLVTGRIIRTMATSRRMNPGTR